MKRRLDVRKTYKLYIGGRFVRSESGRAPAASSARGRQLDNFAAASRKDLRDALVAARKAQGAWAAATACLKGQILYRAAEMLEGKADELAAEIRRSTECAPAASRREVTATIRGVYSYLGSRSLSGLDPIEYDPSTGYMVFTDSLYLPAQAAMTVTFSAVLTPSFDIDETLYLTNTAYTRADNHSETLTDTAVVRVSANVADVEIVR